MKYEDFDPRTVQAKVHSPEQLIAFIRMLKNDIVRENPEISRKRLADVLEGVAAWIEDTNPPDNPDWGYVARLMVATIYYD